ncbi:MAG TPA: hypothetical protein VGI03_00780 [Verrucomicrobiae bacterium]|jgi:hypothetical protein
MNTKFSLGLLSIAICLAGCASHPVSQLHVVSNYFTTGENVVKGVRTPATAFTSKDVVVYVVDLQWDNANEGFGGHNITFNWYNGTKLVSTFHHGVSFDESPVELPNLKPASSLGAGHFKVELLIDKTLIASKEFDINQ